MINKRRKIIRWVLLIAWMSFIFYMSNQNGDTSTGQSNFIVELLSSLGLQISETPKETLKLIIRKGAHFSEYFILYILSYRVLTMYIKLPKASYFALLLVFLYACTDELHQFFIPGRTAAFKDVIIDTLGGFIALLSIKLIRDYSKSLKNKCG